MTPAPTHLHLLTKASEADLSSHEWRRPLLDFFAQAAPSDFTQFFNRNPSLAYLAGRQNDTELIVALEKAWLQANRQPTDPLKPLTKFYNSVLAGLLDGEHLPSVQPLLGSRNFERPDIFVRVALAHGAMRQKWELVEWAFNAVFDNPKSATKHKVDSPVKPMIKEIYNNREYSWQLTHKQVVAGWGAWSHTTSLMGLSKEAVNGLLIQAALHVPRIMDMVYIYATSPRHRMEKFEGLSDLKARLQARDDKAILLQEVAQEGMGKTPRTTRQTPKI